ncbi:hypothetical protein Hypma_009673 [Hypsizygus marmoreus]|uniref:Retrotransposon Copia-like N-terminal domain-containing protein n=1 Tax=Hypsizygus marmoreus TaxID=39966 RepID=A0A369JWS0_HYPMA|nr:hypothetical protein Hypma_009673 [Hypsizygus marmoreus]
MAVTPTVLSTDLSHPSIQAHTYRTPFTKDALSKDKGNYRQWARDMQVCLTFNVVGAYVLDPPSEPNSMVELRTHANWKANNSLAWSIIFAAVDNLESEFIAEIPNAKEAWNALKKRHEQETPMKQVSLLHRAMVGTWTSETEDIAAELQKIIQDASCTFAMGKLTRDLYIAVCVLNHLSDDFAHIRSILNHDLAAATEAKPITVSDLHRYIDQEQDVRRNSKEKNATSAIALAARTSSHSSKSSSGAYCSACKMPGHSIKYCVGPDGEMKGKTVMEAKAARQRDLNAKRTGSSNTIPKSSTAPKVKVTAKDKNGAGHSVTVYDSNSPATYDNVVL